MKIYKKILILTVLAFAISFGFTDHSKANWFTNLFGSKSNQQEQYIKSEASLQDFLKFYDEALLKANPKPSRKIRKENSNYRKEFINAYAILVKNYVYKLDEKQKQEVLNKTKKAILKKEKTAQKKHKKLTNKDISYTALRAMYDSLDPHTAWLDPQEAKMLENTIDGQYEGVGIVLGVDKKMKHVIANMVIEGGPADKAGVKDGDIIYKVNNKAYTAKQIEVLAAALKGKRHTKVRVEIIRDGKIKHITITRDRVILKSVKGKIIDHKYAYIHISSFSYKTTAEMRALFRKININKTKGIILDLRNNPGGLLYSSLIISNMFVQKGELLSVKGRNKSNDSQYFAANNAYVKKNIPVVVLVNNMTASAAEIVSAALSQTGRAIIMGQPSFGKGSVQTIFDLNDKSVAKITIQLFYTPNGNALQGVGVTPDIYLNPVKKTPFFDIRETKYKNYLKVKHSVKKSKPFLTLSTKECKSYGKDKDKEIGCAIKYFNSNNMLKEAAKRLQEEAKIAIKQ